MVSDVDFYYSAATFVSFSLDVSLCWSPPNRHLPFHHHHHLLLHHRQSLPLHRHIQCFFASRALLFWMQSLLNLLTVAVVVTVVAVVGVKADNVRYPVIEW